jgi:hypothetical protein
VSHRNITNVPRGKYRSSGQGREQPNAGMNDLRSSALRDSTSHQELVIGGTREGGKGSATVPLTQRDDSSSPAWSSRYPD